MKAFSIVAAAAGLVFAGIVAGTGGAGADDYNYPGSCLVVQNHSGTTVDVSLNYPIHTGYWTSYPDDIWHLSDDDIPVTTPNGVWNVELNPSVDSTWVYDSGMNIGIGCNGSWVLTLN
ncbi:hypothetical protein AB0N05_21850 [Nocardia sp. NPDC051030]|uniref:hypothetical protein n=1 Tax=Nocardia sp. NPDC051030 TaxID=3155162 RepID=UPI0034235721